MNSEKAKRSVFKPTLSLFDATAINVGAIIGAGIFVVTGIAAGYAGSALQIRNGLQCFFAYSLRFLTILGFASQP
ncbi:MAG: hypothetical protein QXI91_06000 [Candidatus Bathyarchaeia archaeon]